MTKNFFWFGVEVCTCTCILLLVAISLFGAGVMGWRWTGDIKEEVWVHFISFWSEFAEKFSRNDIYEGSCLCFFFFPHVYVFFTKTFEVWYIFFLVIFICWCLLGVGLWSINVLILSMFLTVPFDSNLDWLLHGIFIVLCILFWKNLEKDLYWWNY